MVNGIDTYKDSGVEWIGKIPQNWKLVKTGRIFRNIKEIVKKKSATTERLALTLNGVIKRNKDDAEGLQPEQFDSYQYLRKNQLVFKLIDLENVNTSRVGLCPFDEGMVSPAYIVLQNNSSDNRYYHYYFVSLWHNEIFNHLGGDGVRSALNSKDLLNIPTFDLPTEKQQAIADYLDKKCGEIDKIVETETAVIEKLKEYKQSIITEAVTKGLDKSVPLKDSGIEWIGKIPAHWEVCKIKYLAEIKGRIGFKGYTVDDLADAKEEGCAVVLGGTNIMKEGYISYDKLTYLKEYKYLESPEIMLHGGEILITKVGAGTGDNAIYKYYQERVTINPNVMLCVPKDKKSSNFINYFLLSPISKTEVLLESTKSGAQPAINQQFIKNHIITLPPVEEQQQIADYLDKKCSEIDKAISDKEKVIEKFIEYKKSLIYECVTGKKEMA